MFKMSTIHANTCMHSNDYTPFRNRCRYDGVVEQPSLPQQTEQTFFQLLHIMDLRTADPLLKYTPDAVVQIRRIGWPHLWRDKIWRLSLQHGDSVTCIAR